MADKKISELGNGGAAMPGDLIPVSRGSGYAYIDMGHVTYNGQLNRWKAALGKYRAGLSNARLVVAGDSIARGYGASTTATSQAYNGLNSQIAKYLISRGEKASSQAFFGNGTLTQSSFDGRISQSTWAVDSGFYSMGGELFSTSGTPTFGFTPNANNNTCDIWLVQYSGGGTITKQANAVTGTDVATNNATAALFKTSLTAASVSSTNLYKVIGKSGTSFLCGMESYDATNKAIVCSNAGWFGAECDYWTQNGFDPNNWDPNQVWDDLAFDLVIFDCGGNDIKDGKTRDYMMTEYQKIIDNVVAAGSSMILTITAAPNTTWITAQQMADYVADIYTLGATNNLPVCDLYSSWGGSNYTAMNALGMYRSGDDVHLSGPGYADFANKLMPMVYNP